VRFRGVWSLLAASLAALTVAGVVGAVGAKTIRGTARADLIRGTSAADTIYGLGGNDQLFGLGGNDRLIGGPGTDRISCGAGRDRVIADARDKVARDCEFVTRPQPPSPPPPPTPPPPPPPPSPPPPTGPLVAPGHYVSSTPQGRYVHFDVQADGRSFINLRVEYNSTCKPDATLNGAYLTVGGAVQIASNRTFAVNAQSSDGSLVMTLQGVFDTLNNASGAFNVKEVVVSQGTRYECDSGTVSFSGKRQ
jgi:Ca2+-binding RTX toxin-like protein